MIALFTQFYFDMEFVIVIEMGMLEMELVFLGVLFPRLQI